MITSKGKAILAKYLIGQAPSYASYIAVGCGPSALRSEGPGFTEQQKKEYAKKTSLDFEMFRVPIISRGYVNENNLTKLVLTAELPTEERYEITEIGIFSAEADFSAEVPGSKNFFIFTQTEGWEHHTTERIFEIPTVYTPLDVDEDNVISGEYIINGTLKQTPVFHTNANNRTFTNLERVKRNERCRFFNNIIMIVGNNATLLKDSLQGVIEQPNSNYIEKTQSLFNFNKNSPKDEIKLAFSLINKNNTLPDTPDNVKILVKFSSSSESTKYASFCVDIDHIGFTAGNAPEEKDFTTNRYFVVSKKLEDLYYTSNFNWTTVNLVKIYAQVTKNGSKSSNYYVALDGMRLENLTTINPLYGMTGYSVVKTDGGLPIKKEPNTANYIEFRVAIGVE